MSPQSIRTRPRGVSSSPLLTERRALDCFRDHYDACARRSCRRAAVVVRHTDIRCGHGRRSAGCCASAGHFPHRLIRVSAACALLAGVAWLAMESAVIAGADNVSTTMQALPVVALRTQYGQWFVLRCVLLIVLLVMPLSRRVGFVAAILLAGIALAVQPLLGHAGAMGGNVGRELIASEIYIWPPPERGSAVCCHSSLQSAFCHTKTRRECVATSPRSVSPRCCCWLVPLSSRWRR